MPTGTISGVSKVIKKSVLGVMGALIVNQGGPCSSIKVPAHTSQVLYISFQGDVFSFSFK